VLEAPVEIELLDSGSARLRQGRVVAHVPPRGRGFSIETPQARVVEYGTEFGVGVRDGGETEVQVFQGAVVAEWKDAAGQTVDRRLDAGQAVVIDQQTQRVPRGVPYYPEGFVRTFPARPRPGGAGRPAL
jgi:ferric-dicitrate binding protein FerR (iron transport regulator)